MIRALRFTPLLASAVLFLLPSTGCKKPEYPACKKDKHCDSELNETCVDGNCQNCKADADCEAISADLAGFVCHEFRCTDPTALPPAGSGTGDQGDPCTQITDCVGGLTCKAGSCDFCTEDTDCGSSTCNLESGRCGPEGQCSIDDDCAMDEICDGGMCIFSGDYGGDGEVLCDLEAIFFAFDSDVLTPTAQEKMQAAAACMAEQGRNVILEAHADNLGTEEYNILLTDKRGTAVKNAFTEYGVPAETMTVVSKGALEAMGSDEASRAKDRRVQLMWE
jgi:peptidoglycan-associated lipoprotein